MPPPSIAETKSARLANGKSPVPCSPSLAAQARFCSVVTRVAET
jgi:hypothetical protein